MDIVLTPQLLNFLIRQGYQYCISKTSEASSDPAVICIALKPVYSPPLAVHKPEGYNEYYIINEEPLRLAEGIDGVRTTVNLDKATLFTYFATMIGVLKQKA